MTQLALTPMFACFAGHGEAELRMLLGTVGIIWVVAGLVTLGNVYCLALFAARRRPMLLHVLLLSSYSTVAALMFTGWMFEAAPQVGVLAIVFVPTVALIHGFFVIRRFRLFRKNRSGT